MAWTLGVMEVTFQSTAMESVSIKPLNRLNEGFGCIFFLFFWVVFLVLFVFSFSFLFFCACFW